MEYVDVSSNGQSDPEGEEIKGKRKEKGKGKGKDKEDYEEDDEDNDEDEVDDDKEDEDANEMAKSDFDEEKPPVTKFGPPLGKPKQTPLLIPSSNPAPVAGSSTLPPSKHRSKKKNPKDLKLGKVSVKETVVPIVGTATISPNLPKSSKNKASSLKTRLDDDSQVWFLRKKILSYIHIYWNFKHKALKKMNSKKKKGDNQAEGLQLEVTKRPSDGPSNRDSFKKTLSKKRKLEEDLSTASPSKRMKTDGSKKARRGDGKVQVDESIGVSKQKSLKVLEPSTPTKPGKQMVSDVSQKDRGKKRKIEGQELTSQSSGNGKRIKKNLSKSGLEIKVATPQ